MKSKTAHQEGLRDWSYRAGSHQRGGIRACLANCPSYRKRRVRGPGGVGAHAGLYEGQRPNWLPGKQSPRARPLTTTSSPAQVIPPCSQVWLLCVEASSHPASTWTLPVMGSSPPCAPSLLSLGGRISHLWNQTQVCLCPHRAAHTLVPMCHGIPPPHSGCSLFQAKHAPGRAGSPNIQLPNCWPAPVVETTPAAAAAEMTASRGSLA